MAVNVGVPAVHAAPARVTAVVESFLHEVIASPAIKITQIILMFIEVLFIVIFICIKQNQQYLDVLTINVVD
jgi:hypothetical protein